MADRLDNVEIKLAEVQDTMQLVLDALKGSLDGTRRGLTEQIREQQAAMHGLTSSLNTTKFDVDSLRKAVEDTRNSVQATQTSVLALKHELTVDRWKMIAGVGILGGGSGVGISELIKRLTS